VTPNCDCGREPTHSTLIAVRPLNRLALTLFGLSPSNGDRHVVGVRGRAGKLGKRWCSHAASRYSRAITQRGEGFCDQRGQ
jgi:hypothetical protein